MLGLVSWFLISHKEQLLSQMNSKQNTCDVSKNSIEHTYNVCESWICLSSWAEHEHMKIGSMEEPFMPICLPLVYDVWS